MKRNIVIKITNEQHECFVSEVVYLSLDLRLVSMMLMCLLFPIEPDFMAHAPLIGLEEVIDPPFVTPSLSGTSRDATEGVLSLLSSPVS